MQRLTDFWFTTAETTTRALLRIRFLFISRFDRSLLHRLSPKRRHLFSSSIFPSLHRSPSQNHQMDLSICCLQLLLVSTPQGRFQGSAQPRNTSGERWKQTKLWNLGTVAVIRQESTKWKTPLCAPRCTTMLWNLLMQAHQSVAPDDLSW